MRALTRLSAYPDLARTRSRRLRLRARAPSARGGSAEGVAATPPLICPNLSKKLRLLAFRHSVFIWIDLY